MKDNFVVLETEDGEEVEFAVLEQTTLGGVNYLLVSDESEEEEGEFLVLKEVFDDEDEEMITLEMIEDEKELEAVVKVFSELLEDVDLEV